MGLLGFLVSGEECERSIQFDSRKLEIKDLTADIPGMSFTLSEFKTEIQKIREASEYSQALDNYQYQMCKICKSLGKDDPEWRQYNKLRIGTIQLLTEL